MKISKLGWPLWLPCLFLTQSTFAFDAVAAICNLSVPLAQIRSKDFERCTQGQLDDFYRRLSAGPRVPHGEFRGRVQIARPQKSEKFNLIKTIRRWFPNFIRESEEFVLERLWQGKVFDRQNANRGLLRNRVFGRALGFPAHVYYGASLLDSKKLSIVIDYSYNQGLPGFHPAWDWMANDRGLQVRDEIRQVNAKLYLGRAYTRGKFLLNFTLEEAP